MARNQKDMIVGVDIGSVNIRAIGCVYEEEERLPTVIATYKRQIEGVSRGNITEKKEVSKKIIEAVNKLEEDTGRETLYALVSIGSNGLSSSHANGYAQVSRGDAVVTELDIENAIKDATRAVPDIKNKSVIHSIPIKYKLDGNEINGNILGLKGNKLEVRTLFVTYPNQLMEVLKSTLDEANIKVTDVVAGPIAESIPLLSKKQKFAGVALVNIGAQVTSILVYENNVPILISTIGVGGDDITKDIALGMKVTLEEAEDIKCGKSASSYSKRKVEDIVEARLEDICIKINKELEKVHRKELLPAGVLICGGSSQINIIENVFRNIIKLPIKVVTNELVRPTKDLLRDSSWARVYGLTLLSPQDNEKDILKEMFTNIYIRVKKYISAFLP